MKQGRSTGAMTVLESRWVTAIKRHGCVCCQYMGYPHDDDGHVVEAHHLLSGGIRIGHLFTVGLCLWHHRGRLIVNGWNHAMHQAKLGPALERGSRPFELIFGDNDWLMQQQREILLRRDPALIDLVDKHALYGA